VFKQYKQELETWLRGIVRDEVSPLNTSLQSERATLRSTIKLLDAQVHTTANAINTAVDRLEELSHIRENYELRAHLKDLNAKFTDLVATAKQLHTVK
jgi:uncharacterized coiled-coil DUF342 family protein